MRLASWTCWQAKLLLLVIHGLEARDILRLHPKDYAKPDYFLYHHKSSLLQAVQDVVAANPKAMKIETLHKEDDKYASDMQVVTVETGGLSTVYASKARVFIGFGEHAREYISAELGLRLLETLSSPAAIIKAVGDERRGQHIIKLLDHVVFKILPMENANGRDIVERGQLCERKNGRGVDTNRNWPVDWGKKEKDYSAAEENPGPRPFSEPETQTVYEVARQFQPQVWLNIHSGMEAMFVPWDHQHEVAPKASEALKILQTIKTDLFTSRCVVGSGGRSVGYLAHGTATDYMFKELEVPIAYTWEIYGDLKADMNDCFRMFNPIGKKDVEATMELWLKAMLRLIELLPGHPATSGSFIPLHLAPASQQPTTTTPQSSPTTAVSSGANENGSPVAAASSLTTVDASALHPSSSAQAWKRAVLRFVGMALLLVVVLQVFKKTGPNPRTVMGKSLEDRRSTWV